MSMADNSPDPPKLTDQHRLTLLEIAERVIRDGARAGRPHVAPSEVPAELVDPLPDIERATFVTVYVADQLNGCIGQLQATRPIWEDVRQNAHRAAFADRRFEPLTVEQLPQLDLHISVLDPLEEIPADGPERLWEFVEPGRHGLLLMTERRRGTFLPSVWEKCPDPDNFLVHLKRKAGLPPDAWPDDLRVFRYTVDEFDRPTLEGIAETAPA